MLPNITNFNNIIRIRADNSNVFTGEGTNSYILLGDNENILIDPGPDLLPHMENIKKYGNINKIKKILITHRHFDHIEAVKNFPKLEIYAAKADSHIKEAKMSEGHLCHLFANQINDGDEMSLLVNNNKEKIKFYHIPGHSSDHIAIGFGEYLFTGDHIMKWSTTIIQEPNGNLADYLQSLSKIAQLPYKIFLPAHGSEIYETKEYIDYLIKHRLERLAQIKNICKNEFLTSKKIAEIIYQNIDKRLQKACKMMVYSHLLYLYKKDELITDNPKNININSVFKGKEQ